MKRSFNSCHQAIHDRRSIHGEANSFMPSLLREGGPRQRWKGLSTPAKSNACPVRAMYTKKRQPVIRLSFLFAIEK